MYGNGDVSNYFSFYLKGVIAVGFEEEAMSGDLQLHSHDLHITKSRAAYSMMTSTLS